MTKHLLLVITLSFLAALPFTATANSNKVIITEFMAINSNGLVDGDGEHSDWIELFNNSDADINLNGWYLTDKADALTKWQFPSVVLTPGAYLVVFASEKDKTDASGFFHTNFKLSGSGEYLAIYEPDGSVSYSYSPAFTAQRQDVSYGIYQGQEVFFTSPSPGAENVFGSLPFAPNFSTTRGFYKTAIEVALTSPSSDCSIYYTLDGTRPSKTSGTLYTTPIQITKTTPLSAIAINTNNVSSEIITHTYWFISDIVKQPAAPSGYPSDWKQAASSTSITADYEMDPEICNGSSYKDFMEEALTSIPSMNIVTTKEHLFSPVNNATTGGIYIYTGKPSTVGLDWVRPSSVEYYDPATGKEFQINCRLKLHGGNSRNPINSSKHGFELAFKSTYGPSKLNFNLFDEKGASNEFNSLVLRAGYNYSWALLSNFYTSHIDGRLKAQYLQDPWTKTTQLAMGKTSGHERFVHLYINGLYWGLYNVAEEYTNDFMESYMKGDEADFDIIKERQEVVSGTIDAFNALIAQMTSSLSNNTNYQKIQGKNADGTVNASYANLLDMDNYIDYMLLNYYIGNLDWNKNNWTMARNRVLNQAGFRFFCWDAETSMTNLTENLVSAAADAKNPTSFIQYLIGNADFKVLLADRVQKHMVNTGGALTPAVAAERYIQLADEIDMAIIAESARWGDCNTANSLHTKNDHWLPRKNDLLNNYFPYRTDVVIEQLKDKGYLTMTSAPVFTHSGGNLSSPIDLGISASSGTIYYTTDGADPRAQITGAVATTAKTYANTINVASNLTVRARAKASSEWSAITEATFLFDTATGIEVSSTNNGQLTYGNYPNPFREQTRIAIKLPVAGNLQVDIYSIDGHLLESLYDGEAPNGNLNLEWMPKTNQTGIYLCKIIFQGQTHFIKLIRK